MKKILLPVLLFATAFALGYSAKTISIAEQSPKKVTGIGGIFFKCKDPKAVRAWYNKHLGLEVNPYGAVFEYYQGADSTQKGFLQWSPFKETTTYFGPSTKDFMINYRVANLSVLIADLKNNGVTIVDTMETYDYGKFVHILDLEGNKIELWEPNDKAYEEMGIKMNLKTTK